MMTRYDQDLHPDLFPCLFTDWFVDSYARNLGTDSAAGSCHTATPDHKCNRINTYIYIYTHISIYIYIHMYVCVCISLSIISSLYLLIHFSIQVVADLRPQGRATPAGLSGFRRALLVLGGPA